MSVYTEAQDLLSRLMLVIKERNEALAEVERLKAALWAVRRAWSGRDASCDWGLHSAIEGDAADALHGGNAAAARVEAEVAAAYRRGAEAMREAAAKACEGVRSGATVDDLIWVGCREGCVDEIRNLPVPEEK